MLLSILGRYSPIGLIVGAQLAIIAFAPTASSSGVASTSAGTTAAAGSGASGSTGSGAAPGAPDGGAVSPGGGSSSGPGGGVAGVNANSQGGTALQPGGGGGSSGGAGGSTAPGTTAASGDVSHCVAGREFDPSVAWFAPACTPGTPGAAAANNGGATYKLGVTADQIEIVDYITNYGAEINAILEAQHTLITYEEMQKFDQSMANFLNKYFVLWGRKVHIDTVAGQCNYQDDTCMFGEINGLIDHYKPYMFFWYTPVCPECFADIASKGVIAVGGESFSADFAKQNAPFFYNSEASATTLEESFADWWCGEMTSVNSNRKVTYTADNNPAQPFNNSKRVLGFISPNKPDNENTITNFLYPRLQQLCGEDPGTFHHYWYAQDINTAAQQVAATMAAMDTPQNPATDIVCICDVVAPQFLFQGESNNNYWPENLIADSQGMGWDSAAQNYDNAFSCPDGPPCAFDDAIGLSSEAPQEDQNNSPATRIWHAGGGSGALPSDSQGDQLSSVIAETLAQEYVMMGTLIEGSGAQLDPWTMQKQAAQLPAVGGGSYPILSFKGGDWNWTQSVRVAWWDAKRQSGYDKLAGSWVSWPNTSTWYQPGQIPSEPNGPPGVPPSRQRS